MEFNTIVPPALGNTGLPTMSRGECCATPPESSVPSHGVAFHFLRESSVSSVRDDHDSMPYHSLASQGFVLSPEIGFSEEWDSNCCSEVCVASRPVVRPPSRIPDEEAVGQVYGGRGEKLGGVEIPERRAVAFAEGVLLGRCQNGPRETGRRSGEVLDSALELGRILAVVGAFDGVLVGEDDEVKAAGGEEGKRARHGVAEERGRALAQPWFLLLAQERAIEVERRDSNRSAGAASGPARGAAHEQVGPRGARGGQRSPG
mmetsp:Transcript_17289/g.55038  ORF Transcript_17289/g.55038 Transcript_17289/m.55038 type:complete len:260 (-) Transcript_17289:96-875(-)